MPNEKSDSRLKIILIGAGVLVACFAIGGWYWKAQKVYEEILNQHKGFLTEYQALNVSILDVDGRPLGKISYLDLRAFKERYPALKLQLLDVADQFEADSVWLSSEREHKAQEIRKWVSGKDVLFQAVESAELELRVAVSKNEGVLAQATRTRTGAINVLKTDSDTGAFSEQAGYMFDDISDLESLKGYLEENLPEGDDLASLLHRGGIRKEQHKMENEITELKVRVQTMEYASRALENHKLEINKSVAKGSEIIYTLNSYAKDLYPAITSANRNVRPLRQLISQLEKPILGTVGGLGNLGDLGDLGNSLFGGGRRSSSRRGRRSSSGSMTPLSLIKQIDPATGHSIETLKTVCDMLQELNRDMGDLLDTTRPFIRASNQFKSSHMRQDMQTLLAAGGPVKTFFDSQMNAFDPITKELDNAQASIRTLNGVVRKLRVPAASSMVANVARTANNLISIARQPIKQAKKRLGSSSRLVEQIQSKERRYLSVLQSLKTENPDILKTPLVGNPISLKSSSTRRRRSGGTVVDTKTDQSFELLNGVSMAFVYIEPGRFLMGSKSEEPDRGIDEGPAHEVKTSNGFHLGKFEVTQSQWKSVMGQERGRYTGANRPVETVSWNDVQSFIHKLNESVGESLYRLPTEAEWEYACRAGTTTRWAYGEDESELAEHAWFLTNNSLNGTKDVGKKSASSWGVHDMQGNVWEWCQDWYGKSFYANSPSVDPQGPSKGSGRVIRGGYFKIPASALRPADRFYALPTYRGADVGFRLVRIKKEPSATEIVYEVFNAAKDTPGDPYLNLRSSPKPSGSLSAKMPDGAKLHVLEKGLGSSKRWWKVDYVKQGKIGYAHSKWLRVHKK